MFNKYIYDTENSMDEWISWSINDSLNFNMKNDMVYRVIYNSKDSFLIIIFYREEYAREFLKGRFPKYACDTSDVISSGLSIIIKDPIALQSIIDKEVYGRSNKKEIRRPSILKS